MTRQQRKGASGASSRGARVGLSGWPTPCRPTRLWTRWAAADDVQDARTRRTNLGGDEGGRLITSHGPPGQLNRPPAQSRCKVRGDGRAGGWAARRSALRPTRQREGVGAPFRSKQRLLRPTAPVEQTLRGPTVVSSGTHGAARRGAKPGVGTCAAAGCCRLKGS